MDPIKRFTEEKKTRIKEFEKDSEFQTLSKNWVEASMKRQYVYNFNWLGRPIIQYPQDIMAIQELVWSVRPDLIIETGIAHGGSLVLSASMLAMLDYCDAVNNGTELKPNASKRGVLGIDIDIRTHNRKAIEAHPLAHLITMIQGPSTDPDVVSQVYDIAKNYNRILVILDSNHTHAHVLAELEAYAKLTSIGSYCCVLDTFIEDMPQGFFKDRPWDVGNNAKTAVWEYLRNLSFQECFANDGERINFEIDKEIELKLQITVAPDGFLRRM